MAGKGGAWKVAYADFATAMMAFFLVMWITSQGKPIKQAVSNYFEDPYGVRKGATSTTPKGPHESTIEGHREVGRGPAKGLAMAEGDSQSRSTAKGVDARLPPKLLIKHDFTTSNSQMVGIDFIPRKLDLGESARPRLDEFTHQAGGKPQKIQILAFPSVGGQPATPEDRQLGFQRARKILADLVSHGIEPQRIQICLMEENVVLETALPGAAATRDSVLVTLTDVVLHD